MIRRFREIDCVGEAIDLNLPEWAKQEEVYRPNRDRDYFISRSLLRVMAVLAAIRRQAHTALGKDVPAIGALCFLLGWLLLCVASHTTAFLICQLALEVIILCFLTGQASKRILQSASLAGLFSLLLVLPAFWWGNGVLMLLIPFKTFLTVTALGILQECLPWNQLTGALRFFHIPQPVIFLLDTTLHYVILLGEMAEDLLTALKLRSVGHNGKKYHAIGGVLGVLFLRSQEMSEILYEAMVCRGFTGEYYPSLGKRFHRAAVFLLMVFLGYCYLFLLLEVRL